MESRSSLEKTISIGAIFAAILIFGCVLSFVPMLIFDKTRSSKFTDNFDSNRAVFVLFGSICVCSFMALEEALDIMFSSARKHFIFKSFRLLSLFSVILPTTVILSVNSVLLISCLNSFQMISLFLTMCMILHLTGPAIWDYQTLIIGMPLIVIGVLLRCFGSYNQEIYPFWLGAIPLGLALIFFYYKCAKWFCFLNEKSTYDIQDIEILCSCYVLMIFFYTIISLSTAENLFESEYNESNQGEEFCIYTYCNTALVLLCTTLGNLVIKARLEKIQVSRNSSLLFNNIELHYLNMPVLYLQDSIETQKSFIRYISHEMRTPLNTVFIGLKLLQEHFVRTNDVPNLDIVKDIRYSCDKAISTLNEVLILDKLETGKLVLEAEYISPYEFILEVLNPFHIQVAAQ